jgi:hypothetical protein
LRCPVFRYQREFLNLDISASSSLNPPQEDSTSLLPLDFEVTITPNASSSPSNTVYSEESKSKQNPPRKEYQFNEAEVAVIHPRLDNSTVSFLTNERLAHVTIVPSSSSDRAGILAPATEDEECGAHPEKNGDLLKMPEDGYTENLDLHHEPASSEVDEIADPVQISPEVSIYSETVDIIDESTDVPPVSSSILDKAPESESEDIPSDSNPRAGAAKEAEINSDDDEDEIVAKDLLRPLTPWEIQTNQSGSLFLPSSISTSGRGVKTEKQAFDSESSLKSTLAKNEIVKMKRRVQVSHLPR